MIFFNENNLVLNEGIMDVPATEMGIEAGEAGCYRALHESTVEWFNLREKMMKLEHHAYVTEDTLLLEAGAGDFFKKIAAMFKKLLGMVKEMWNNFVKKFHSMTMKDKDFAKKYGQQLRSNAASAKLKVKGFKYEGLGGKLDKMSSVASSELNTMVNNANKEIRSASAKDNGAADGVGSNKDEAFNTLRGSLIGKGATDSEDFNKELYDALQGDEEDEIEITISVVESFLTLLNTNEKELKKLENIKSSLEKCYSDSASLFEKLSTQIDSKVTDSSANIHVKGKAGTNSADLKGNFKSGEDKYAGANVSKSNDQVVKATANKHADYIRQASGIVQSAFAVGIEVFKKRHSFARATLGKLLTAKAAKNEGFQVEASILDRF